MIGFPNSYGLLLTYSTFFVSSRLIANFHWRCYCTVHFFYFIADVCDNVWHFFGVEANLYIVYFIVCLYQYWILISNHLEFHRHKSWYFVVLNGVKQDAIVLVIYIEWIIHHHCWCNLAWLKIHLTININSKKQQQKTCTRGMISEDHFIP
jgi:hypothetical protein